MLQWLKRKREPDATDNNELVLSEAFPSQEVLWRADTHLPIPDWQQQPWPEDGDEDTLHRHANGWAAAWLDATATALDQRYTRAESAHFMLLSALEPRATRVLLDYLERSRKRVLAALAGIATDEGHGKTVVMVFGEEDLYYRYIANYGSDSSQPEAHSSGMFVDAGYGHFVFTQGAFETMEPVVVHEMTHCLVRHLQIPAWLNEGLAVNTEHRFVPVRPRYRPNELQYLFANFWDASTIQEFWSGKSFPAARRRPSPQLRTGQAAGAAFGQGVRRAHALLRGGPAAGRRRSCGGDGFGNEPGGTRCGRARPRRVEAIPGIVD